MILKFHKPHHLNKLHDEILEAVPALRPQPGPSGEPEARLLIGGDGQAVEMVVPDDLAPEDLAAIEAWWTPTTRRRRPRRRTRMRS